MVIRDIDGSTPPAVWLCGLAGGTFPADDTVVSNVNVQLLRPKHPMTRHSLIAKRAP